MTALNNEDSKANTIVTDGAMGGKKICLMGASTQTNNRGVSALAVSMVKLFSTVYPEAEFTFLIGSSTSAPQRIALKDRELLIPTVGYRFSPKAHPRNHLLVIVFVALLLKFIPGRRLKNRIGSSFPLIAKMQQADIIGDIQGGDSFSDIYGLNRFLFSISLPAVALLLGKKLVLLPQTYGPYTGKVARFLTKKVITGATTVFSRDRESFEVIRGILGGREREVRFCPDVAFLLDPISVENPAIEPPLISRKKPLVGINVNGLMYHGGYTRSNMFGLVVDYKMLIVDMVRQFLDRDATILLVPHTYGADDNINSDPFASRQVMQQFPGEDIHIVAPKYNQSEIKAIIGCCDFFIGSRMHSCIAALSQGIPAVGIAYSRKFVGVFDSVGMGQMVIDCRSEPAQAILEEVVQLFVRREEHRKNLVSELPEIRETIVTNFRTMAE